MTRFRLSLIFRFPQPHIPSIPQSLNQWLHCCPERKESTDLFWGKPAKMIPTQRQIVTDRQTDRDRDRERERERERERRVRAHTHTRTHNLLIKLQVQRLPVRQPRCPAPSLPNHCTTVMICVRGHIRNTEAGAGARLLALGCKSTRTVRAPPWAPPGLQAKDGRRQRSPRCVLPFIIPAPKLTHDAHLQYPGWPVGLKKRHLPEGAGYVMSEWLRGYALKHLFKGHGAAGVDCSK